MTLGGVHVVSYDCLVIALGKEEGVEAQSNMTGEARSKRYVLCKRPHLDADRPARVRIRFVCKIGTTRSFGQPDDFWRGVLD